MVGVHHMWSWVWFIVYHDFYILNLQAACYHLGDMSKNESDKKNKSEVYFTGLVNVDESKFYFWLCLPFLAAVQAA